MNGHSVFYMGKAEPGIGSVPQIEAGDTHGPVKDHGDPHRQYTAVDPAGKKITAPHPHDQHGTDGNKHRDSDIIHGTQDIGKDKGTRPHKNSQSVMDQYKIKCQTSCFHVDFTETKQKQGRQQ